MQVIICTCIIMGASKFEVDTHQFCITFHSFNVNKKGFQKLAGLWLAGEMVNRIGIYGFKVAEGLSTFQRRSCYWYQLVLSIPEIRLFPFKHDLEYTRTWPWVSSEIKTNILCIHICFHGVWTTFLRYWKSKIGPWKANVKVNVAVKIDGRIGIQHSIH